MRYVDLNSGQFRPRTGHPRFRTILLDMDGPLAAFDHRFWDLVRELGIRSSVQPYPEHQTARYSTDHIPSRSERRHMRSLVDGPGWFTSLEPTAGAVAGVQQLLSAADDAGVFVAVCSKPLVSSPTCLSEKVEWLTTYFPDLVATANFTPDKSLVVADTLLDDAILVEQARAAFWRPVVFPTTWNQLEPYPTFDWPTWSWGDPLSQLHPMLAD